MEGPTDDTAVLTMRARQQRNFIATLLLSQGVPMLLHGDELGRTQQGNNNGYAQDNPITWVDWESVDQPLVEFTAALARLRRQHPTFRRRRFFDGRPVRREEGMNVPDIVWLRPDGSLMEPDDWEAGFGRAIGVFLNGNGIRERDRRGEQITDEHFAVLFNAGDEPVDFTLPDVEFAPRWDVLVDTAGERANTAAVGPGDVLRVEPKSLMVLCEHREPETEVDHSVAASLAQTATSTIDEVPGAAPHSELPR